MAPEMRQVSDRHESHLSSTIRDSRQFILDQVSTSNFQRGPSEPLLHYLLENRFNLALVPRYHGGHGLNFLSEFNLILEATRLDGTFGWLVFQLAGNPGRVLSYFSPETVDELLEAYQYKIVFSYQNDPSKATARRDGRKLLVSGKWSFGTLSKCATHFVIPFTDPTTNVETCLVLPSNQVDQTDNWRNRAFLATSIGTYQVVDHVVSKTDLVARMELANKHFSPSYSVPRSSIKHIAWSMGMALNAIDTISTRDALAARAPKWLTYQAETDARLQEVRQHLVRLEEEVHTGTSTSTLKWLADRCSSTHKHALNGVMSAFVAFPQESLDEDSVFSRNLFDTAVLSLHKALRQDLHFL